MIYDEKNSRFENSKRNIIYGILGKGIHILFKFVIRTVIIYFLGAIYLGLDGLFLNIISVLSIAELGIGNAVCFALYKPFANNDNLNISAYINFFKKTYKIISVVIMGIGIGVIPLLKYIVNFNTTIDVNYYIIYFLFLVNSVVSFLFGSYYQILFIADQREYVVNNVKNGVFAIASVVQVISVILCQNYYLFLIIMIIGTIVTNICLTYKAHSFYPFIIDNKKTSLSEEDRNNLKKNVFALTLTKISTIIYTSSDNIVISGLIGTVIVGYYSNYAYAVSAVSGIISVIFSGMLASVGNINASESAEHLLLTYKRMLFLNRVIYGFVFICLHNLFQDFIYIWAGAEYLLDDVTVFVICLMFLLPGFNHTNIIFKDACGLFWETRYRTIATAGINILLSILLAPKYGLSGVFIATIISYFMTTFLIDPEVIMKKSLKCKKRVFYFWYIKSTIIVIALDYLDKLVLDLIPVKSTISFIIKSILCAIIVAVEMYIIEINSPELKYLKSIKIKIFREIGSVKKG